MDAQDLKAWRTKLGITQEQAAKLMGISRPGWRRRESGDVSITQETVWACRYLAGHPDDVRAYLDHISAAAPE